MGDAFDMSDEPMTGDSRTDKTGDSRGDGIARVDGADLPGLDDLLRRALQEDLPAGDVTSRAVVPAGARAHARIVAKSSLVFCGAAIAARVFALVDAQTTIRSLVGEGQAVPAGGTVIEVTGSAQAILASERTALNLLQRTCGIATITRGYVDASGGRCRISDTRKTMPGLRLVDRYAVRCGGGFNHRNDLSSGVLIKENHIRVAGGVEQAVRAARARVSHVYRIECEVTSLEELRAAMAAGADIVLLDNMDDDGVRDAVRIAGDRVLVEVSGGITLARVHVLAAMGVHVISVGALTHSVPAADLSLLFDVDAG